MEKLYITEEIANHEANKHLNLEVGALLRDPGDEEPGEEGDTCGGVEKPKPPVGQVGEYLCNGTSWVWVPAV